MPLQKIRYCTCGGQKNCFKCDGKGWIDELKTGVALGDSDVNFPPVLKEYSQTSDSGFEKIDFGRKKPLVTQGKAVDSVPISASNMEAARAKQRKLTRAAKKAAMNQDSSSPKNGGITTPCTAPATDEAVERIELLIKDENRAIRKIRIKVRKVKVTPKKIDMLDSRARLPGSFETGKKR